MVILKNFNWYTKDKKIRKNYKKWEINKKVLKSLLYSIYYNPKYRFLFIKIFHNYPKKSSISSYRSSCMITGFGRSIFRQFKLSRHFAKYYASNGYLLGLRKSSF